MLNSVTLVGRLTADPEIKRSGETIYCHAMLAVQRAWTKQGDERVTDFIPIAVFGKTAEFLVGYARKGQRVSVVGSLESRNYEDKTGTRRTAYTVTVRTLELIDYAERRDENPGNADMIPDGGLDDLPF